MHGTRLHLTESVQELYGVATGGSGPSDDVEATGKGGERGASGGAEGLDEAAGVVIDAHGEGQGFEVVGAEMEASALRVVGQGIVKNGKVADAHAGVVGIVRIVRIVGLYPTDGFNAPLAVVR